MQLNVTNLKTWSAFGFRSVALIIATAGTNLLSARFIPEFATKAAAFVLMQNLLSLVLNANALYYSKRGLVEIKTSWITLAALYLVVSIAVVFQLFGDIALLSCVICISFLYSIRNKVWSVELNNLQKYCFIDGFSLIFSAVGFLLCLYWKPQYAISAGLLIRAIVWNYAARRNASELALKVKFDGSVEPFVLSQVFAVAISLSSVIWASHQSAPAAASFVSFITMLSLGPLAFNYCSRFLNRLDYLGKSSSLKREIALIIGLAIYALAVAINFALRLPVGLVFILAVATIFQTAIAPLERRLWVTHSRQMLAITMLSFTLSIFIMQLGFGYIAPVTLSILVLMYFILKKNYIYAD